MEILRFSNHFSQINEQGNKSSSHSHLSLLYLIPAGQVSSATETFKLHPLTEDYLFNDRLGRAVCLSCIPLLDHLDCLQFSE